MLSTLAGKVNSPIAELEKRLDAMVARQRELEKQMKSAQQKEAADLALIPFKRQAIGDGRLRHAGPVKALAFSPDGKRLASAGDRRVDIRDGLLTN